MDSLTFNKFAAGILVALLLVMGIGKLGNLLYGPEEVAHEGVMEEGGMEMAADEDPGLAEGPEMSLAALLNAANLGDGEKVFNKCKACHTVDEGGPNRVGPNLWGVVGGPVAHMADFAYSSAIEGMSGDTWTFEALDAFIHDPKGYAPGTKMTFAGLGNAEDRANLLAWLNQQSSNPIALPEPPAEAPASEEMIEQTEDAAAAAGDVVEDGADAISAAVEDTTDAVSDAVEDTAESATAAAEQAAAAADSPLAMIAAGDVENGEKVMRKCKSCHTFDEGGANRVGPNLWGVVGRPVASHEGYSYSSAMEDFGGDWTYERLWDYLHDPRGVVPGTKMSFAGISDDEDLADLLAWMRLQASDPVPIEAQ